MTTRGRQTRERRSRDRPTRDERLGPREAPKVKDLPAPRRAEGAAGGLAQRTLAWPFRAILAFLIWARVWPWELSLASLLFTVATGGLILAGWWFAAFLTLLLSGLCDVFDGAVARHRGLARRSGAFLDSVLDRISDMILFGSLFWVLAGRGETLEAALALVTLVVSLFVSQIRAEAEAVGVTLTEGLFQRLERFLALMVGLAIPGAMPWVLLALAVLGGVTVLQRGWAALVRA